MSWLGGLFGGWLARTTSLSTYPNPYPPGSQNNDGFERNHDNPLVNLTSEQTVLRLSAVWSCVKLLSETISTLPVNVYERLPSGGRRLATDHPLYPLVHRQPNADMTAQTFWQAYVASMLLGGDAIAEKITRNNGTPIALDLVPRGTYTRLPDANGNPVWRLQRRDGSTRDLGPEQVFQTLAFTLDGKCGLSPIAYGASVFLSATSADLAANSTFRRGLLPTIAFTMAQIMKKEQRGEFRENFARDMAGAMNAGKPVVLEGGMTAAPLGINPVDAQLLESRAWSVEEICRWFGVPPHMIGHMAKSTSWGTGIEQQMIGFLTFSLTPWLRRIEQSATRSLFLPAERDRFYAEFEVTGLLRADSAARASYLSQMVQNGLMSRDEARAYDNREPMGGNAAELTVQSNLVPIDKLGEAATPAATAVQDALKSFLGIGDQHAPKI